MLDFSSLFTKTTERNPPFAPTPDSDTDSASPFLELFRRPQGLGNDAIDPLSETEPDSGTDDLLMSLFQTTKTSEGSTIGLNVAENELSTSNGPLTVADKIAQAELGAENTAENQQHVSSLWDIVNEQETYSDQLDDSLFVAKPDESLLHYSDDLWLNSDCQAPRAGSKRALVLTPESSSNNAPHCLVDKRLSKLTDQPRPAKKQKSIFEGATLGYESEVESTDEHALSEVSEFPPNTHPISPLAEPAREPGPNRIVERTAEAGAEVEASQATEVIDISAELDSTPSIQGNESAQDPVYAACKHFTSTLPKPGTKKRNKLPYRVVGVHSEGPIYPPCVNKTANVPRNCLNPTTGLPWRETELLREYDFYRTAVRKQRLASAGKVSDEEDEDDYEAWVVRDFSIYGTNRETEKNYGWTRPAGTLEMTPLSYLRTKSGVDELFLEGLVSFDGGKSWKYVDQLLFATLSVEGYLSEQIVTVRPENIYIQSRRMAKFRGRDLWLQLVGEPSRVYRKYYQAFLWVATLAKYVVEYVSYKIKDEILPPTGCQLRDVSIGHFRAQFAAWMNYNYGQYPDHKVWRSCLSSNHYDDYRSAVTRHSDFLWKEICGIEPRVVYGTGKGMSTDLGSCYSTRISLWHDILVLSGTIPQQPLKEKLTTVSSYVRHCFSESYFTELMEVVESPEKVLQERTARERQANFLSVPANSSTPPTEYERRRRYIPIDASEVCAGMVVALAPDDESGWKKTGRTEEDQYWYAYVQEVQGDKLSVIWVYRSTETLIGQALYPIENELFLSDHCNCQDDLLRTSEVLFQLNAAIIENPHMEKASRTKEWFEAQMANKNQCFIRQAYMTVDVGIQTLTREHLTCRCKTVKAKKLYQPGETVLALVGRSNQRLDPFVVVDSDLDRHGNRSYQLRKLPRISEISNRNRYINELAWSDEVVVKAESKIVRRCNIRVYHPDKRVPPPYSSGGSGDCWILSYSVSPRSEHEVGSKGKLTALESPPGMLIEGFDPSSGPEHGQALNGLSLFTGGGSLDRGLEAAHGVRTKWSVEWDLHSIHTSRANAFMDEVRPGSLSASMAVNDDLGYWYGSIDDFIATALRGESVKVARTGVELIPKPGQVGFLSSGSPCQGFSFLQKFKLSEDSRRNSSRVASTATALWLYLPDYFIIENVPNMARMLGPENIFCQLVSSAVGLGYQVRPFHIDSWATGAPQSRCRMFLVCSAPGLTPIGSPTRTHSHPPRTKNKALGTISASGIEFGVRDFSPTPFKYVTAAEASADLPNIYSGHLEICLKSPDHVLSFPLKPLQRARCKLIPIYPRESCLYDLYKISPSKVPEPVRSDMERLYQMRPVSRMPDRSWRRVNPDKFFPTITTSCVPMDRIVGQVVHWSEGRPLSIAEARRAQGWQDDEVLIGRGRTQWKIIGNGVPRQIGVAWGVQLRYALEQNRPRMTVPVESVDLTAEDD